MWQYYVCGTSYQSIRVRGLASHYDANLDRIGSDPDK